MFAETVEKIILAILCSIILYFIVRHRKKPKLRLLGSGSGQVNSPDGDIMDATVFIYNDPYYFFVPVERDTAKIRSAIINEIKDGLEIRRGNLFWQVPGGGYQQSIDIPARSQAELVVFWKFSYAKEYFVPERLQSNATLGVSKNKLSAEVASYRIQIYDADDKIYKFDIKAVDSPQSVNIRKNTTLNDRGDLIREGLRMIVRALDWRR